jgi:hypothetical protein
VRKDQKCAKYEPQVGRSFTEKTTGRTSEHPPGEADESGIDFTKIKGLRKRALLFLRGKLISATAGDR